MLFQERKKRGKRRVEINVISVIIQHLNAASDFPNTLPKGKKKNTTQNHLTKTAGRECALKP